MMKFDGLNLLFLLIFSNTSSLEYLGIIFNPCQVIKITKILQMIKWNDSKNNNYNLWLSYIKKY